MKTIGILAAAFLSFKLAAQTNSEASTNMAPATNHVILAELTGPVHLDVDIIKVEPDGLTWSGSEPGEFGFINFTNLPEAVRKEFHYDPDVAAEFTSRRRLMDAHGRIAAEGNRIHATKDKQQNDLRQAISDNALTGAVEVFQKLDDGFLLHWNGHIVYLKNSDAENNIFVQGDIARATLFLRGNYSYKTQAGPERSVHRVTVNIREAIDYYNEHPEEQRIFSIPIAWGDD